MVMEIEDAFVKQFESEAHLEYQRMGSAIRNTVRTKANIKGKSTTFQVAGSGTAGGKDRHGLIPQMNTSRAPIEVSLTDRYASDYVDDLDELKLQHDERGVITSTVTGALGRDTDDILFTAMDASANPNNSSTAVTWSAAAAPIAIMEEMGNADVPMDRNLFAVVPWEAWGDLLDIDEFSHQDYVPQDKLWFEGVTAKFWLGFNWFPHSGLPVDGSGDKKMFFYHKQCLGHAIGKDLAINPWYDGNRDSYRITGKMSHGAGLIDDTGCIEKVYDITP